MESTVHLLNEQQRPRDVQTAGNEFSLSPFSIGGVNVDPSLVLAPMSGVTNSCFRRLIKEENPEAVGLVVTEFISIEGLTRGNLRSHDMMKFLEEERPVSVQIFGHEISRMVASAKMIEDHGADIIDINCGCPVPKVVRKGGGCELMRQPAHLAKMLESVRAAVSIPLTLKIRAGWDDNSRNALEIAHLAQESGVEMLAVHGRTRRELYRGKADWSLVHEIASELKIPVVGSGDVEDADSAYALAGGDIAGIMIGRAALFNPWVFSEISAAMRNQEFERPDDVATVSVLRHYQQLLSEEILTRDVKDPGKRDRFVLGRMKQFTSQVTRRVNGSATARRVLCQCKTLAEYSDQLLRWEEFLHSRGANHVDMIKEPTSGPIECSA